jgi:NADPH-dependent 2,4-dienoyl-CoA reductase/sulfur reductase-like enzyme
MVILGGALSGPTAAARAREIDASAKIILLERGPTVSYAVGGLAYYLSGEVRSLAALDRERRVSFATFTASTRARASKFARSTPPTIDSRSATTTL